MWPVDDETLCEANSDDEKDESEVMFVELMEHADEVEFNTISAGSICS
jgi:hypothetical protein